MAGIDAGGGKREELERARAEYAQRTERRAADLATANDSIRQLNELLQPFILHTKTIVDEQRADRAELDRLEVELASAEN